jgi:uncharacterized damage-inducible protein DinB
MMNITELLLQQFDAEAITTRKMLALVPADKFDWQPHPKSMTLRQLAGHVAELPLWVKIALTTEGLDLAADNYSVPPLNNAAEVLGFFERCLAEGRQWLQGTNESQLEEKWILSNGQNVIFERRRYDTILVALSQTIHHRAQLGVYLRLLDVPIPGSYGPSADGV